MMTVPFGYQRNASAGGTDGSGVRPVIVAVVDCEASFDGPREGSLCGRARLFAGEVALFAGGSAARFMACFVRAIAKCQSERGHKTSINSTDQKQ